MSDYRMRGVPAQAVSTLWHYAEPYIKRALDHTCGELKPEHIHDLIQNRDVQLWLITRGDRAVGAITTEIVRYPAGRTHARVITLGGSNLTEWIELADNTLTGWAIEQGCQAIEAYVRKGLVPKLAPLDWLHKHSIVVKEFNRE